MLEVEELLPAWQAYVLQSYAQRMEQMERTQMDINKRREIATQARPHTASQAAAGMGGRSTGADWQRAVAGCLGVQAFEKEQAVHQLLQRKASLNGWVDGWMGGWMDA